MIELKVNLLYITWCKLGVFWFKWTEKEMICRQKRKKERKCIY